MSENLNQAIKTNGESITKQPLLKSMRTVRKDILKLMALYITQSTDEKLVYIFLIYLDIIIFTFNSI